MAPHPRKVSIDEASVPRSTHRHSQPTNAPDTPRSAYRSNRRSSLIADHDVLGLPRTPRTSVGSQGLTPRVAQETELTSDILEDGGDWASECLLLTHEPMRLDMAAMCCALDGLEEEPAVWRVRSFFRFFDAFASLVHQQFSVSLLVHNDWLCAHTASGNDYDPAADGGFEPTDHRVELLRHQRDVTHLIHDVLMMEETLATDATAAANPMGRGAAAAGGHQRGGIGGASTATGGVVGRSLSRMPSSMAWRGATSASTPSTPLGELRARVDGLCAELRQHLRSQEEVMPEVMRAHFGSAAAGAPPSLMLRSIAAARCADGGGGGGGGDDSVGSGAAATRLSSFPIGEGSGGGAPGHDGCGTSSSGAGGFCGGGGGSTTEATLARQEARALAAGAPLPTLLPWVMHYLHVREPQRARAVVAHLPRALRRRLARIGGPLARDASHAEVLHHLEAMTMARPPPPRTLQLTCFSAARQRRHRQQRSLVRLATAEVRAAAGKGGEAAGGGGSVGGGGGGGGGCGAAAAAVSSAGGMAPICEAPNARTSPPKPNRRGGAGGISVGIKEGSAGAGGGDGGGAEARSRLARAASCSLSSALAAANASRSAAASRSLSYGGVGASQLAMIAAISGDLINPLGASSAMGASWNRVPAKAAPPTPPTTTSAQPPQSHLHRQHARGSAPAAVHAGRPAGTNPLAPTHGRSLTAVL